MRWQTLVGCFIVIIAAEAHGYWGGYNAAKKSGLAQPPMYLVNLTLVAPDAETAEAFDDQACGYKYYRDDDGAKPYLRIDVMCALDRMNFHETIDRPRTQL